MTGLNTNILNKGLTLSSKVYEYNTRLTDGIKKYQII